MVRLLHRRWPAIAASVAALAVLSAPATAATARPATALTDPVAIDRLAVALDAIYAFHPEEQRAASAALAARLPGHPLLDLVAGEAAWWRILANPDDRSQDRTFLATLARAEAGAARRLARRDDDLDGLYVRATALALRGRLRSLRGDVIAGAYDAKRSVGLVRTLAVRHPGNEDLLLGLGLFDYFAAVTPEHYPALKPLRYVFGSGDRERGLRRLELAARQGRLSRTEAAYFLLQIHYGFEDDLPAAARDAAALRARYPDNPVFHAFAARIAARQGNWKNAEPLLQDLLRRVAEKRPGYGVPQAEEALYLLVRSRMASGDNVAAVAYSGKLEELSRPRQSPFLSLAYLRRGMAYDALGTRQAAIGDYRRVLALPDSAAAHASAKRYLRTPFAG